jgi:hypothetical protein
MLLGILKVDGSRVRGVITDGVKRLVDDVGRRDRSLNIGELLVCSVVLVVRWVNLKVSSS